MLLRGSVRLAGFSVWDGSAALTGLLCGGDACSLLTGTGLESGGGTRILGASGDSLSSLLGRSSSERFSLGSTAPSSGS